MVQHQLGPGSGKGTVSRILAEQLGFHYLDSGALYRLLGLVAVRHGLEISIHADLSQLAKNMDVSFQAKANGQNIVLLEGVDVTDDLRTEETGALASRVAENPSVRSSLLERQHQFARLPGLVADGRDMGTKVFPEAQVHSELGRCHQNESPRALPRRVLCPLPPRALPSPPHGARVQQAGHRCVGPHQELAC